MHIPDGFLDPKTAGSLMAAGVGVVALAYSKVKAMVSVVSMSLAGAGAGNISKKIGSGIRVLSANGGEYLSRIVTIAAFIFAAQMFNFPVANGTSGHLLGAVLAVLFLGQWGGIIAITMVLVIQAFFFSDGGFLALGANVINMAGFGCLISWYIYRGLKKFFKNIYAAIFVTAWFSVIGAATFCSAELAISGKYSFSETFLAMLQIHNLIGIGEALITLLIVVYLTKVLKWSLYEEK